MQKKKFTFTDFVCLECGNVNTTPIVGFTSKKFASVEELWCYKCNHFTKHYDVKDIGIFMETDTNDIVKVHVKDLVNHGKNAKSEKMKRLSNKISNK